MIERCKKRLLIDGRAGNSGRRPHTLLRKRIEKFWLHDVEKEPSHYCSTKGKQWCVGVTSVSHGFLMFLVKYFTDKFNECVAKQYFPGLHKNLPPSLRPHNVPVMACDDCIAAADGNNLAQVVCPHMPKFNFFYEVTRTFNLGFKRPGSDQCEKCNALHDRIVLLRAMGRHDEADGVEDRLSAHEELDSHHFRAEAFRSAINELQHCSKTGNGRTLEWYNYNQRVEWASRDLIQSISMDAGSGLRTPFCRVAFACFSRVLVTPLDPNLTMCTSGTTRLTTRVLTRSCHIMSIFITKSKTGTKLLVNVTVTGVTSSINSFS